VCRIPGPASVPVTALVSGVRATLGEDVTVLTDVPIARAHVGGVVGAGVQVSLAVLPGLTLSADSMLAVAAWADDRTTRVGTCVVTELGPRGPGSSNRTVGLIEWEADGLSELGNRGRTPALLSLAAGRSLRMVGPVEMDSGRVLRLPSAGRWVLAPSTKDRAMLVRGRGLRIRAAQISRSFRIAIGAQV
jgi:hypothetical protein